ncbi:MAG: histidine kinase [Pseudomonadota bacterium]
MDLKEFVKDRSRFYWVLNIGGWTGYIMAAYLGAFAHEKPESIFRVIAVTAALGFLLTFPLRAAFHYLWNRPPLQILTRSAALCWVLAAVWTLIENRLYWEWVKQGYVPTHWVDHFGGVMGAFYVLMSWSGLYFGIKYYLQLQEQTQRTLAATAAAHQAQLKMLRYQLNPHFLFNTLNAISTLILDRRNDTANLAVTRLSDFLRYSLDNDPMKRVTLRQELEALDLYLEIEMVRFGDRLVVKREVEAAALDALVPSLILQPLIENAIKYAITPREDGGTITIAGRTHDGALMMTIADDGPGLEDKPAPPKNGRQNGAGVGLRNTRERLKQVYGDAQAMTLAPATPHGLAITINIPLERHLPEGE